MTQGQALRTETQRSQCQGVPNQFYFNNICAHCTFWRTLPASSIDLVALLGSFEMLENTSTQFHHRSRQSPPCPKTIDMLGKLTIDALPFYSGIAMAGALIVVLGALGVVALITWLGQWRYLWTEWLTSLDHKKIGIMYVTLALIMLVRGVLDAMMIRTQQAVALELARLSVAGPFRSDLHLPCHHHGFLRGDAVRGRPVQRRRSAADRCAPGGVSVHERGEPVADRVRRRSGHDLARRRSGFPPSSGPLTRPNSGLQFSPGVGVDYWIWAILVSSVGSLLTGINFLVTIVKRRAPGMRLMMMPLFTWSALFTNILIIFAYPALIVAAALLGLDRYLGMHFFTGGDGGNVKNYISLFWIWGHPHIYILILPAFGIYSEVVATFSGRRLFGYASLVYAIVGFHRAVVGRLAAPFLHHGCRSRRERLLWSAWLRSLPCRQSLRFSAGYSRCIAAKCDSRCRCCLRSALS